MTERFIANLIIVLCVTWLILTATINISPISVGVCGILLTLFISYRAYKISNFNLYDQIRVTRLPMFVISLLLEIIKANLSVFKVILTNKVSPQLMVLKNDTVTEAGEYILSLCITLTPGSLIMEYNPDELLIHVLDEDAKNSLLSLTLNKLVKTLENPNCKR